MKCQILSIGDELVMGDISNTNACWLAQNLTEYGVDIVSIRTIGDKESHILQSLHQAIQESDLVIITGGLGPTDDDITKYALTKMFNSELIVHEPTQKFIKEKFKRRNISFSHFNYGQAKVPANAEILFNKQDTAPGLWFEKNGCSIAALPGIPHEMKALMKEHILPKIRIGTKSDKKKFFRYIQTAGVAESNLSDEIIGPLSDYLSAEIEIAYLPSAQRNTIRISTTAHSKQEADDKCKDLLLHIYGKAENYIIGEGKTCTLSETVSNLLIKMGLSLAVAESCTGGNLSDAITDTPGSSGYMRGSIIAYDNSIKVETLGVHKKVLNESGAVSKPVALQMAKNIAQMMKSDIGISTTGIAGPGGGTEEKPVGTVWIGFWSPQRHLALQALFTDNRLINKKRTTATALELIRRVILKIETMPYGLKPHFV